MTCLAVDLFECLEVPQRYHCGASQHKEYTSVGQARQRRLKRGSGLGDTILS